MMNPLNITQATRSGNRPISSEKYLYIDPKIINKRHIRHSYSRNYQPSTLIIFLVLTNIVMIVFLSFQFMNYSGNNTPKVKNEEILKNFYSKSTDKNILKLSYENLLLGIAIDVEIYKLLIFYKSLYKLSTDFTFVLFVDNNLIAKVNQNEFQLVKFLEIESDSLSKGIKNLDPQALRLVLFRRYLINQDLFKSYNHIWLLDVSDIFFQSNPFEFFDIYDKSILHTFQQEGFLTIGESKPLTNILRKCFGPTILKQLDFKKILSSSILIGNNILIMKYLEISVGIISGENFYGLDIPVSNLQFCSSSGSGLGSVLHNAIIYSDLIPNHQIHKEQDEFGSFFADLNHAKMSTRNANTIVNHQGKIIPIIHHYNNNFTFEMELVRNYVPSLVGLDPMTEWNNSLECNSYHLANNYDLFPKLCDIKQTQSILPSHCCLLCNRMKGFQGGCHAFVYALGTCFLKHCEIEVKYKNSIEAYESTQSGLYQENTLTAYKQMNMKYIIT